MSRSNLHICSMLLVTGWLAILGHADGAAFHDPRFMNAVGELVGKLEISLSQDGFAGTSGTIWTIAPNGDYQASRFLNQSTSAPYAKGKLDSKALRQIARILQQQDFLSLPQETGQTPPINPKRIKINFGQQVAVLTLPPGQTLQDASGNSAQLDSDPRQRLLTILHSVLDLIDPRDQPQ